MTKVRTVLSVVIACVLAWSMLYLGERLSDSLAARRNDDKLQSELAAVMPGGGKFEPISITDIPLPDSVTEAYTNGNGGMVFRMSVTGYAPGMVILCGVDGGRVAGAVCTESRETLGQEKSYGETLVGMDSESIGKAETVSGATFTTSAYRTAVADALKSYDILLSGDEI